MTARQQVAGLALAMLEGICQFLLAALAWLGQLAVAGVIAGFFLLLAWLFPGLGDWAFMVFR